MDKVFAIDWGEEGNIITCNGEIGKYYFGYDEEIDPVLMQFTGFKDENRVEIYEGDILKPKTKIEILEYDFIGVVCFDEGVTRVIDTKKDSIISFILRLPNIKWEVIGNIYENLELMREL